MRLHGTRDQLYQQIGSPDAFLALSTARQYVQPGKQEILPYQALALFKLARKYDGGRILEIGTYYGFSAAMLAQAAPRAEIITLNPRAWEMHDARKNLSRFKNVQVVEAFSWDYFATDENKYDMTFIDGDHKRIREDLPWWNRLNDGGLFFHHDFSPNGSTRACPPVYRNLLAFRDWLGREFDVLIVDDEKVGMAGFYRRADDPDWKV